MKRNKIELNGVNEKKTIVVTMDLNKKIDNVKIKYIENTTTKMPKELQSWCRCVTYVHLRSYTTHRSKGGNLILN